MILWSGTAVLWAGPAILEAGTAVLWVRTAVLWTGTAVLEAVRTDSRCFQTLPGTFRSSLELPEDARSWTKLILAGFFN